MRKCISLGSAGKAKAKSLLNTAFLPLIFVTDNSAQFFLVRGGGEIRDSALGFHLCPRVPPGCGPDTHVNAMGVGPTDYSKMVLCLCHSQPVSCYSL